MRRSIHMHGLNNSLIRWVHRHNHVATLFRSPSGNARTVPAVRNVPATGGVYTDPFDAPGVRHVEEKHQMPDVRQGTTDQVPAKSNQVFVPAQIPSADHNPSGSVSTESHSESSDPNWKRLQAIFRKHQEVADANASSPLESSSMNQESQGQAASPGSLSDREQPETGPAGRPSPQPAFHTSQAGAGSSTAETTSTDLEPPDQARLPDPPPEQKRTEPKHAERPGQGAVFRKPQVQAAARPGIIHRPKTSPAALARPVQRGAEEHKQSTHAQQGQPILLNAPADSDHPGQSGHLQGPPSIQSRAEEPEQANSAGRLGSVAFQTGSVQPVAGEGLNEPQRDQAQGHPVHSAQRMAATVEEGTLSSQEGMSFKTEASVPARQDVSRTNQRSNILQRVWQDLGTIFRKQQAPAETKTAEIQRSTGSVIEPEEAYPQQPRTGAEPSISEIDNSEIGQAPLRDQPAPTAVFPNQPTQPFHENVEDSARSDEPESTAKSQARLSSAAGQEPVTRAEPMEAQLSETITDLPDQAQQSAQLPKQPVPLQAVWNVQRLADEEPEMEADEPVSFSNPDSVAPSEALPTPEATGEFKSTTYDEERQHLPEIQAPSPSSQPPFDSSRAPVEILPPSRPRPAGATVAPSRPAIQRRPENRHPTMVNTAIGPLPSDLWSLLGQKPPVSPDQQDMQRQTTIRSSPSEASSDQKIFLHEHTLAPAQRSIQASHPPAVLQRQAESSVPATGPEQQPASPSEQEEKASTEPDLQDLAQKVYAEVRRRLATESERTHRYI